MNDDELKEYDAKMKEYEETDRRQEARKNLIILLLQIVLLAWGIYTVAQQANWQQYAFWYVLAAVAYFDIRNRIETAVWRTTALRNWLEHRLK